MAKALEAKIVLERLPLARESIQALRALSRYDIIAFTSKKARKFFEQELRKRRIAPPKAARVVTVGPRNELLKLHVRGKRILFPRSSLAPYDIVRKLRARGATVRTIPLYSAHGAVLSRKDKAALLRGGFSSLYFKSPSGVAGLLRQMSRSERAIVLAVPALCIGKTTAQAARKAGFKRVSIKNV